MNCLITTKNSLFNNNLSYQIFLVSLTIDLAIDFKLVAKLISKSTVKWVCDRFKDQCEKCRQNTTRTIWHFRSLSWSLNRPLYHSFFWIELRLKEWDCVNACIRVHGNLAIFDGRGPLLWHLVTKWELKDTPKMKALFRIQSYKTVRSHY